MKARTNFVAVANDIGASEQAVELADEVYLAALGLYLLCLGYCDRQRTDGHIPAKAMRRAIAPGFDVDELVQELVRVGFLHAVNDGWQIAGYLDWQRSRDEIESAIEQRREAGRASAAKRAGKVTEKIDKTRQEKRRPTDKSALGIPFNEPLNEPLNGDGPASQTGAEGWRARLQASQIAKLEKAHGIATVALEAERLVTEEQGGLDVASFHKLLAYRLTHPNQQGGQHDRRTPDGTPLSEVEPY